jgi:hypothetical protein
MWVIFIIASWEIWKEMGRYLMIKETKTQARSLDHEIQGASPLP